MPVLEHQARHFVLLGKEFQHILRGGDGFALAAAGRGGQAKIGEQNHAKLFGRVDVEALAGQLEDALADAVKFAAESLRKPAQRSCVDAHAGLLHAIEHGRERQIDVGVDAQHAGFFSLFAQRGDERMNGRGRCGQRVGGG